MGRWRGDDNSPGGDDNYTNESEQRDGEERVEQPGDDRQK